MGTVRPLPRNVKHDADIGREKGRESEGPNEKSDDRHYGNAALSQHWRRPCTQAMVPAAAARTRFRPAVPVERDAFCREINARRTIRARGWDDDNR